MRPRLNLKFISISLGIVLWVYVNMVIPPSARRTVKADIDFRNLPARMRVLPRKAEADIVLSGSRRDFIFAGKDSVQASVDLYTLRPGPAFFPLKVSTPSGLTVVAMKPAQIEVYGEPLSSRKLEVTVDFKGQIAEGFIGESPIASPSEVTVEGPRDVIDKITSAQVVVALSDAKNSISETRKIQIFGAADEITNDIKVIPDKINVVMTVKAGYPSRMYPIIPNFINKPPEGFKLDNYSFTPPEIMISGPQRVLDQLANVRTVPIDLSTLLGSSSIIALLDAPVYENVKIAGSNTVVLQVKVVPVQLIKTFSGLPLTLKNRPNQHCTVSPASYSLVLKGFADDLSKISTVDLEVILDTTSMASGSYFIPLPCPDGLPAKIEILEILPPKANIQVSILSPTTSPASSPPDIH